jgi:hypothetical protein
MSLWKTECRAGPLASLALVYDDGWMLWTCVVDLCCGLVLWTCVVDLCCGLVLWTCVVDLCGGLMNSMGDRWSNLRESSKFNGAIPRP